MKTSACCFTGYRPNKMPFPLTEKSPEYIKFENKLTDAVFSLPDEGCKTFYSGMAMGFDIIAAETVLLLKQVHPKAGIKLICAVPFPEQSESFSEEWKQRYRKVIEKADEVVTVCDRYSSGCFQLRNRFMVDNSDIVITWFDGRSGGTKNTLMYAQKKNSRIVNLAGEGVHEYYTQTEIIFIDEDE